MISKLVMGVVLAMLCVPGLARAEHVIEGPLYPVSVHGDIYTIHRALPRPPRSFFAELFEGLAYAAGFDLPASTASAYGWDNTICINNGTFAGLTVPRCTNGDGKFYMAFGMPSTPTSPPSFTIAFDVNNSGGDTTAAHHWCYRGSCAVVTAGGNADTIANLTFGTASALSDNQLTSPCNAANKMCAGAATAAFTCRDNGQAAGCSGTACNDHLAVILAEPLKTSCTATVVTTALDYGFVHLVEAN